MNTWNDVAAVRSGSTVKIYLNGTQVATGTDSSTVVINTLGGWTGSSDYRFKGYISNARVTNAAVYTSNFTPSTTPLTAISGTQVLTSQSNRFVDNNSNAYAITTSGSPSVNALTHSYLHIHKHIQQVFMVEVGISVQLLQIQYSIFK